LDNTLHMLLHLKLILSLVMQPFISLFTAGEHTENNTNSASSDMHLYVRLSFSILDGDKRTQVTSLKYLSYWNLDTLN
jgi:hypothetical protein